MLESIPIVFRMRGFYETNEMDLISKDVPLYKSRSSESRRRVKCMTPGPSTGSNPFKSLCRFRNDNDDDRLSFVHERKHYDITKPSVTPSS